MKPDKPDRKVLSDDRIVDLVHGLLSPQEERELLDQIADDPPAERQLKSHGRALERARSAGAPRLSGAAAAVPSRLPQWLVRPRLAPLAGFAVAVALVVAVLTPSGPRVGDQVPLLPQETSTLRLRAGGMLPDHVQQGLEAYASGEFTRAVSLFEEAESEETAELVRRIYLGSSLAQEGLWDETLAAFETVPVALLPEPWGTDVRWTRMLALRSTGEGDEADALLRAWAASEGPLAERAKAALER